MTPQQQQQPPVDDKDTIAIWNRIVRRRRQELAMLEESAAKSVLQGLHAHLHADGSSLQLWSSSRETVLEGLLMENFRVASNAALPASKRRTAFEVLETLQRRLDEAKHSMTSKPLNSKSVVRGEGSVSAVNGTSKTALTNSNSNSSNSNSRIQAAALVNGTTTLSMATAPASLQTSASTTTTTAATTAAATTAAATIAAATTAATTTATTTSRVSAATTANKHRSSLTATLAAASASTVAEAASAVAGGVVTGVSTMTMMPTTRNDPLQYLVATSSNNNNSNSNSNSNSHLGAPPPYKRTSETVVARQAEKAAKASSSGSESGSRGQSKSLTPLEENIPPPPTASASASASIVATTNSNSNTNGYFNKNSTYHSDKKRKGREDDDMDMDISSSDNNDNDNADADADDNVAPWAKRVATSTTIESPSTLNPTAPTSAATTAAQTKTPTTTMPHTTASTTASATVSTTASTATATITYKERPKIPRWRRKTSTADNISTVDFGEDGCAKTKSYACAQKERRAMTIDYRKQWPNEAMVKDAGRRLEEWEPNWQIEQMVAMGVTVPVAQIAPPGRELNSSHSPNNNNNKPFTVAEFELPELKGRLLDQIPWGKPAATGKPKDGDIALLLRMLPLYADGDDDDVHNGVKTKKQYAYSSHSRADCHLWPKGTFLIIDQKPIVLQQRKQANHDLNKWEYQSHPLSLGPHLLSSSPPTRHQRITKLAMCCYDTTQFLYSVTVCIYKCPETLTNYLLLSSMPSSPLPSSSSQWKLQRLTYEESLEKAMTLIHQQMVFIDDDDDDNKNKSAPTAKDKEDVGKFVFSLVDPVSRQPMKTPVRGRHCKHWQCFDLEYFMQVNAPVYGSRWRCVCCEAFVSYHELQICGLTQQALQTLAKDVSSTRDRVEFRADQTYHLLPPPTLRHAKRHSASSGTTTTTTAAGTTIKSSSSALDPTSFEAIEIIDLD